MRHAICLLLLTLLPPLGAAPTSTPNAEGASPGQESFVAIDAFEQVKQMGRGVNIIGYDPLWKDFSKARFKERHFERIHDAGFQTVRVSQKQQDVID
jgi:endoglucanase